MSHTHSETPRQEQTVEAPSLAVAFDRLFPACVSREEALGCARELVDRELLEAVYVMLRMR